MLTLSRMPSGEPEIFASIQGEGASLGTPSTFVRFAVCNLQCTWCDTAYTWDWSRFDRAEQTVRLSDDDIVARVNALAPRSVVITGGEPLVQRHALVPLCAGLHAEGYRIEVETNGTIPPGPLATLVDQWNVSPKLAHSGNDGLTRIRPEALRAFGALPNAFLKIVVESSDDLPEVDRLVQVAGIPPARVLLMPQGRTPGELEARSAALAALCTDRGYRFTTRLHILLWGDRRGV